MARYARGIRAPYISEYIVDEGATLTFARTKNYHQSNSFLNYCMDSTNDLTILPVTSEDFKETVFEFFRQQDLSFTDCSTLVLMRKHDIRHIVTFDRSFEKVKGVKVVS